MCIRDSFLAGEELSAARVLQRSTPGWDWRGRTLGPVIRGASEPHEALSELGLPKRSWATPSWQ
eukprot:13331606-Alexandrium_andersonii.AAC.1